MTVIKRLLCTVDHEPEGFHDETLHGFSVNLNFEYVQTTSEGQAAPTEKDGQAAFGLFLDALPKVRFHVFRATRNGDALDLVQIGRLDDGPVGGQHIKEASRSPEPLMQWLNARVPESSAFWVTTEMAADPAGQDIEIDGDLLQATHLLRSAQSWDAPVAHRFGLTHLALLPRAAFFQGEPALPVDLVLLPWFEEAPPPKTLTATPSLVLEGCWDVTCQPGGALSASDIVCRTQRLDTQDALHLGDILTPEGYLIADQDSDRARRLLDALEERAATLFSPGSALARLESIDDDARKNGHDPIFAPLWASTPDALTVTLQAAELAWLAASSLASLLDPLLIGLLRPASREVDPNGKVVAWSEGPVLSRLVSLLSDDIARTLKPDFSAMATLLTPPLIRDTVRALLHTSPLHRPDDRPSFLDALRHIHGLTPYDVSGKTLLDVLLDIHRQDDPAKPLEIECCIAEDLAGKRPGETLEGFALPISQVIAPLQQALTEEKGAEAAILRYFETVDLEGDVARALRDAFADALETVLGNQIGEPALNALGAAVSQAWAAFRTMLDDSFDGAEGLRRSTGADFAVALQKRVSSSDEGAALPSGERLYQTLVGADFFRHRLLGPDAGGFADMTALLPKSLPVGRLADDALRLIVETYLKTRYRAALETLAPLIHDTARFIPDLSPQPLSIALTKDNSAIAFDAFARDFNGIGMAIRRVDAPTSPFAHANLAELTYSREAVVPGNGTARFADAPDTPHAVHPLMPAIADGRAPSFQSYEGMPFASQGFEGAAISGGVPATGYEPFYRHDAPAYGSPADGGFVPTPALAYGRAFESVCFVTTNAGTLPRNLRASLPWMPRPDIATAIDGPQLQTSNYQRRTAVGAVVIFESGPDGKRLTAGRRLGVAFDGIAPVTQDDPRIGLVATEAIDGVLDVFRGADGIGQLRLPERHERQQALTITLSGLRLHGAGVLSVSLPYDRRDGALLSVPVAFRIAIPEGAAIEDEDLMVLIDVLHQDATAEPGRCNIRVSCRFLGATTEPMTLDYPIACRFWARLTVKAEKDPVTVSLSDPKGARSADRNDRPLALIGEPGRWHDDLAKPLSLRITAPRVGYTDFERWFANPDCLKQAFEDNPKTSMLRDTLLIAYGVRHTSPAVMEALTKLPDPGVDQLLVELIVIDRLAPQVASSPSGIAIDIAGRFKELLVELPEKIGLVRPETFDKLVAAIEARFSFSVNISTGHGPEIHFERIGNAINIVLPPGMVAELQVSPLVRRDRFECNGLVPSVFYERMLHFSRRITADKVHYVFPGASIAIETLYDAFAEKTVTGPKKEPIPDVAFWSKLARQRIASRPAAEARLYDVVARATAYDPDTSKSDEAIERRLWRAIGEIDIVTQRWRDTGRPIYTMISPKEGAQDIQGCAAVQLSPKIAPDLVQRFEREIFFGRADFDAETVTKQLDPSPATTVLQQFVWNAPSATYLRHRFVLRSRYAGAALSAAARTVSTHGAGSSLATTQQDRWSLRVAMLADYGRLALTRPQLRALVPLTHAPRAGESGSPTPPIAASCRNDPMPMAVSPTGSPPI